MTKFLGLVVVFVAAIGVTLATPATSKACGWRRGCGYSSGYYRSGPSYSSSYYMAPSYSSGYYSTSPDYSSGYWSGRGNTSGYYRVGNVIINGRRWGDIGYRYSHGDLIRW